MTTTNASSLEASGFRVIPAPENAFLAHLVGFWFPEIFGPHGAAFLAQAIRRNETRDELALYNTEADDKMPFSRTSLIQRLLDGSPSFLAALEQADTQGLLAWKAPVAYTTDTTGARIQTWDLLPLLARVGIPPLPLLTHLLEKEGREVLLRSRGTPDPLIVDVMKAWMMGAHPIETFYQKTPELAALRDKGMECCLNALTDEDMRSVLKDTMTLGDWMHARIGSLKKRGWTSTLKTLADMGYGLKGWSNEQLLTTETAEHITAFIEQGGDITRTHRREGATEDTSIAAPLWQWLLHTNYARAKVALEPFASTLTLQPDDARIWNNLCHFGRLRDSSWTRRPLPDVIKEATQETLWTRICTLEGETLLMRMARRKPPAVLKVAQKARTDQAFLETRDKEGLSLWAYMIMGCAETHGYSISNTAFQALQTRLPPTSWGLSAQGEGLMGQACRNQRLKRAFYDLNDRWSFFLDLPLFTEVDTREESLFMHHLKTWKAAFLSTPSSLPPPLLFEAKGDNVLYRALSARMMKHLELKAQELMKKKGVGEEERKDDERMEVVRERYVSEETRCLPPALRALVWFSCVQEEIEHFLPLPGPQLQSTKETLFSQKPLLDPTLWGLSWHEAVLHTGDLWCHAEENWKARRQAEGLDKRFPEERGAWGILEDHIIERARSTLEAIALDNTLVHDTACTLATEKKRLRL